MPTVATKPTSIKPSTSRKRRSAHIIPFPRDYADGAKEYERAKSLVAMAKAATTLEEKTVVVGQAWDALDKSIKSFARARDACPKALPALRERCFVGIDMANALAQDSFDAATWRHTADVVRLDRSGRVQQ